MGIFVIIWLLNDDFWAFERNDAIPAQVLIVGKMGKEAGVRVGHHPG